MEVAESHFQKPFFRSVEALPPCLQEFKLSGERMSVKQADSAWLVTGTPDQSSAAYPAGKTRKSKNSRLLLIVFTHAFFDFFTEFGKIVLTNPFAGYQDLPPANER